jgi:hypothetical protein
MIKDSFTKNLKEQQNAEKVKEYTHSLLQNFPLFGTEYDKEHQRYAKCRKKSRNSFFTGNETPNKTT